MRTIQYIVLHCTATSQNASVEAIVRYWKNVKKWRTVGYHYIIEANGTVHNLLPIEKISNGVAGYNSVSIHIAYVGGIDSKGRAIDNRTIQQKARQIELITYLSNKFPVAKIVGHRDFPKVNKACPSFDVSSWLQEIGFRYT